MNIQIKNPMLPMLFGLLMPLTVQANELVFMPATPIVTMNEQITLSVLGASGNITWSSLKGQIQGSGNQVIYIAPTEAGADVVTVLDGADNLATLKITILPVLTIEFLAQQRAAIIIAGGGNEVTNALWDITEAISNNIYNTLKQVNFSTEEIYYLSPKSWADFDNDGLNDNIVDAPKPERALTVDDLQTALIWTKTQGQLDQPLLLFFTGTADFEKLFLDGQTFIEPTAFKAILDDYQASTGNEIIAIIDAPYSGSFLKPLATSNRAIISSSQDNELAFYDSESKKEKGFNDFFMKGLLKGMNFFEAFQYGSEQQKGILNNVGENISQIPQLDDNGDGLFTDNDGEWLRQIDLKKVPKTLFIKAGETLTLKARASLTKDWLSRVWAELKPPQNNATDSLSFPQLSLSATTNESIWETTWQDAVYNGDYEITFYAQDNEGNIANSDTPLVIKVTDGIELPKQANVQILLEKDSYHTGEPFKAELIEDLGWGYDLYAAVVFPDGHFLALKKINDMAPVNQAKQWFGPRSQNKPITLFDLTLPPDLPTGEYCIYGILSPEREDVFETLAQGLSVVEVRCVNILEQD